VPINADLDPELCIVCLEAVAECNREFYAEIDAQYMPEQEEEDEDGEVYPA
jgi:hypothetical protein